MQLKSYLKREKKGNFRVPARNNQYKLRLNISWFLKFVCNSDAGVLVCRAEEWASQTVKAGEQGTGF